jgi:hypothetical protein
MKTELMRINSRSCSAPPVPVFSPVRLLCGGFFICTPKTGQRDRDERNHPRMVVITLSNENMSTVKSLGKTVGQEVMSFQRSKAPLEIQDRMDQQIRAWRIIKRDRDSGAGAGAGAGSPKPKKGKDKGPKAYWPKAPWPKGRAAAVMQPKKEAWGKEPAGGWRTAEQTAAWERGNQPTRQPASNDGIEGCESSCGVHQES